MFLIQSFGYASGESADRVNDLSAQVVDDLPGQPTGLDDLPADFQADFADDTEDVAFCCRGGGADDKVGAAQEEEMQGVILELKGVVDQLPDHPAGGRRRHVLKPHHSLGRGHVMGRGADSADSWCDAGHLFDRPADGELLETAEFGNLENGAVDVAVVIQEDFDFSVAF